MKKTLLLISFLLCSTFGFSQLHSPNAVIIDNLAKYTHNINSGSNKSAANPKDCDNDTIEYARLKGSAYQVVSISQGYALGQYYDAPDSIKISGATFYGWNLSSQDDSIEVTVSLFKAGIDTLPTGNPIRSATFMVDTAFSGGVLSELRRSVAFATPYTTNEPYIITIASSDSIRVGIVTNSYNNADGAGENIASGTVGGTWYSCLNLNIGGTVLDCDILLEPHVNYSTYAGFTAASCYNWSDSVVFQNNSSPILQHRMYNRYIRYGIGQYSYYWYFGAGTNTIYGESPKYKFLSPMNVNARLITTMYGYRFGSGCRDTAYQDMFYQPSAIGVIADTPICSGTKAVVDALSTGVVKWYDGPSSSTPFYQGKSYITPPLDTTTKYYLQAENFQCKTTRKTVTLPVALTPDIPTTLGDSICLNAQANISATSNAGSIIWWTDSIGGIPLDTGNVYVTPTLGSSAIYYAEADNIKCKSAKRSITHVNVNASNAPLDPITVIDTTICINEGQVTLSASSPSGDPLFWYDVPSGGTSIASGSTLTYNPQTLGNDFVYIESYDGSCASSRIQKKLLVWDFPSLNIPALDTLCVGDTLKVDFSGSFGSVKWYDSPSGSNVVFDSNYVELIGLGSTTSFYLEPYSLGCKDTMRHQLTVELLQYGTLSNVMGDVICANETASISANTDFGVVVWASDSSQNTLIGSGSPFETPALKENTRYYVAAKNAHCFSPFQFIEVDVKPSPDSKYNYQVNGPGNFTFEAATAGLSYSWDFGDGEFATAKKIIHKYQNDGEYTVVLETTNSDNCTSSSFRTVKVTGTGSVNDEQTKQFSMWPNPTTGFIIIDNQYAAAQLSIRNQMGQEVYTGNVINGTNQIDLASSGLSFGVYTVTLQFEDATVHQQLLYR